MGDGIAEMNKAKSAVYTHTDGKVYVAVNEEAYAECFGCCFLLSNESCGAGDTEMRCQVEEVIFKPLQTPLAAASAELAEKGTPLVADVRTFDTGATRDTAEGKSEHVGFNSPLADKRFGEFMHLHRQQSDGVLRESSNWKKGIPKQAYIESLGRHFLELRLMYDGHDVEGTDVETTLCAIRFNTNGFLHEILKEKTS